jgi:hypothetical protein
LAIVERDPKTIWKALEEHYGFGYFKKIMEEEYGLAEDLEILKRDMVNMVNIDRNELVTRVAKISQELKLEIVKRDMIIVDKHADLNR